MIFFAPTQKVVPGISKPSNDPLLHFLTRSILQSASAEEGAHSFSRSDCPDLRSAILETYEHHSGYAFPHRKHTPDVAYCCSRTERPPFSASNILPSYHSSVRPPLPKEVPFPHANATVQSSFPKDPHQTYELHMDNPGASHRFLLFYSLQIIILPGALSIPLSLCRYFTIKTALSKYISTQIIVKIQLQVFMSPCRHFRKEGFLCKIYYLICFALSVHIPKISLYFRNSFPI